MLNYWRRPPPPIGEDRHEFGNSDNPKNEVRPNKPQKRASPDVGGFPVNFSEPLPAEPETLSFAQAVEGLLRGDFSRLAFLFAPDPGIDDGLSRMVRWDALGRFDQEPKARAEAFACACFNGETSAVRYLLDRGMAVTAGDNTGLNGLHWAVNRGQVETVELLIARGAPLEDRNVHGSTLLGNAVWSAIHEPKPGHLAVIHLLLSAGASIDAAGYPAGDQPIDELLERHGARRKSPPDADPG